MGEKMTLATELRRVCGHDSRSVDGCLHCEAADALEAAHLTQPAQCPYIASSDEGTHYCRLAESVQPAQAVDAAHVEKLREMAAYYGQSPQMFKPELAALNAAIANANGKDTPDAAR